MAKMDAPRSSTSRRFYSSMSSALCPVPASKTAVTNTSHLLNQGKITINLAKKKCRFPHRTRLFNILFGCKQRIVSSLLFFYFTCLRCTHTPCLSTGLHLRFSNRGKILLIVFSSYFNNRHTLFVSKFKPFPELTDILLPEQ